MIGTSLSHFRITAKLGEGGMGEVYRSDDTKLGREVAIKVLPEAVAQDPERLARFEREAKVLASLNHPQIAAIYSIESAKVGRPPLEAADLPAGRPDEEKRTVYFLVMELVEGEDLKERIARGPIPIDEALPIALQIAEGLEAAHEKGIIHRDLKPANVKVTPEGKVKVLDFGLAKALTAGTETGRFNTESAGIENGRFKEELGGTRAGRTVEAGMDSPQDLSMSPTLTAQMTQPGVVLGTAAYMSPEQTRGKPIDRRSDNWAFGVLMWEILTGRPCFRGDTTMDLLSSITRDEVDLDELPASTPRDVRRLIGRCLSKDPGNRLQHIGDARIELQELVSGGIEASVIPGTSAPPTKSKLPWILAAGLAVALAAVLGWVVTQPTKRSPGPARLSVQLPADAPFLPIERSSLAVAPDGSMFVYVGGQAGQQQLYARHLDGKAVLPIENTEGAQSPFFSPDSHRIGFYVGNEFRTISATGGPPQTIGFAPPTSRGQVWLADDFILVTPNKTAGLWRVSVPGGVFGDFLTGDPESLSSGYCWPDLLPNGKQALVSRLQDNATSWLDAQILLVDTESGDTRELIQGGSHARYVPTGHIVFSQGGALMAVPFDPQTGSLTGVPITVVDDVLSDPASGVSHFSISATGTLVYARGGSRSPAMRRLAWVGRDGQVQTITPEPRLFQQPRVSPDGRYVVMTIAGASDDIWTLDLERNVFQRITFGGRNFMPIWNPDGESVTFASVAGTGFPTVHSSPIDGSGPAALLLTTRSASFPESWSPDGQHLTFSVVSLDSNWDIHVAGPDGSATPLLDSKFNESSSTVSPDGKWLAFVSDQSGELEVYVASFPDLGGRLQVSEAGGTEPVWAPDAKELFFRTGNQILVVELQSQPSLRVSSPELAVDRASPGSSPVPGYPSYDIAPDGQRFLMMESEPMPLVDHLEVVLNWFEELERLVPAGS